MVPAAEYVVFSVLMALNLGLGLYFSLPRKKASSADTKAEVFLGSRALRVFPLAASVVASLISSTGMVGLTGHFYAYGFHFMWTSLTTILLAPVAGWLFVTVLYELRVTSIFEYIRVRFSPYISLTIAVIYIFGSQSIGALSIFAASLTIVTVFGVSLLWSNIIIGVCATCYTALGGLKGVVWTDCMQLVFILLGPAAVVTKVIIDSSSSATVLQPLDDFDLRPYIANIKFDLSHDENVWVTVAALTACLYRVGMDQVVVQRCMASRSLASAKRTVLLGAVLLLVVNLVKLAMAVALILWFRGCDPQLLGAIRSPDQILPFYIKTYLISFPGFTGLFLAAVVSASTSTISSAINSEAAVIYVDVLSPRFKQLDSHVRWITHGLAFLLGTIMTVYSCVCVYMGSVTMGAGSATLITFAMQLFLMWQRINSGLKPPHMPVTLDYCHENSSSFHLKGNVTLLSTQHRSHDGTVFVQLSPFWSSSLSTVATVVLGILISFAAGENRQRRAHSNLLNSWFVKMWRKLGIMECDEQQVKAAADDYTAPNEALLKKDDDAQPATTVC